MEILNDCHERERRERVDEASEDDQDETVLALRGIEDTSSDDASDVETPIQSQKKTFI